MGRRRKRIEVALEDDLSMPRPLSPWVWVVLALWFVWLAALIYLAHTELGQPRPCQQTSPAVRE